jgi:hypothetical protein
MKKEDKSDGASVGTVCTMRAPCAARSNEDNGLDVWKGFFCGVPLAIQHAANEVDLVL